MIRKVYFPGLNGLRFFSAIAVIITHIELIKYKFGFSNYWDNILIHNLGVIGVSFFFVLSGFLITYLMLIEKKNFGKMSIKNFYVRRIFRIWPLYFLILVLGFFVLPNFTYVPFFSEALQDNFTENLIFYILILPNVAFSLYPAVPLIGQSWSIGVEEQFYIIWPLIFVFFKKFTTKLLFIFLVFILLIKCFVFLLLLNYDLTQELLVLKKFLAMSKFENMIIGSIGAIALFYKKNKLINILCNNLSMLVSLIGLFLTTLYLPDIMRNGMHVIHSLFFISIILNVSTNKNTILKLENKIFNFLGKISYGIYMYHLIVIFFVMQFLKIYFLFSFNDFYSNLILYFISIFFTVLISYLSYFYIENKFLSIKSKF